MAGEFVKVSTVGELAPGQLKAVRVGNEFICLANVGGEYFAINDECTHAFASLHDGVLDGGEVECPLHESRFDVRTGEVTGPPAEEGVKTYQVKVEGDDIFVAS